MTLILGYIHSDSSVHMVTDSAETILNLQTNKENLDEKPKYNSFGDLIEHSSEELVTESAQKIYELNNSILISFSGSYLEGKLILKDLKGIVDANSEIRKTELFSNYFKNSTPKNSEYLIAYLENKEAVLLHYNNCKIDFIKGNGNFILIGSGSDIKLIRQPITGMLNYFYKLGNHPENLIVSLVAVLQSFSLNALTFQKGVGGFFNGAFIFDSKIHWAKDTSVILYSSKNFEQGERFIVNKFNRERATFITSSKIQRTVFFPNPNLHKTLTEKWVKTWVEKLLNLNDNCITDYFTFVCYDRRIIIVLNKNNKRFKENITFEPIGPNKMRLNLDLKLIKKLTSYAVSAEIGKETNIGYGLVWEYI